MSAPDVTTLAGTPDAPGNAGSLELKDLTKIYRVGRGFKSSKLRAADGVSFLLQQGRTIALVGESGSGKSTVAKMITRLETPSSGEILIDGLPTAHLRGRSLAHYRHNVQMVFQDPFASLNPYHSIGHHLTRPLQIHKRAAGTEELRQAALNLLERVNLIPAESVIDRRPHELSGGQRQRVAIARALAPGARFLIADEPVSMLDVSIRLSVLNLLARLQREENLGVLYITHDLATARHFSDEIIVMYHGKIVERGPSDQVILDPQHEYTKLLLSAAANPDNQGKLREEVAAELAAGTSGRASRFGTEALGL